MAAAVVTVIIQDILDSLYEGMKLGQQFGVKHELDEIRDLLSSIVGVLPDAENKYGRSLILQQWVRDVKLAAFDAEDLLEEMSVEEALWQSERNVRRLFRFIGRFKFRRRMHDEFGPVVSRMRNLVTPEWIGFVRNIPAEIGDAHEETRMVPLIGRGREKRLLMTYLLIEGREGDLSVLTVQGIGGIGKTALVKEVCSESEVSKYFNVIIWVNASPPFDENRMARDIIACLTNGGGSTEEEKVVNEQLVMRVWELLDGRKKYLFVVDNLSVPYENRRRWFRFMSFLDGGASGSKILVTTRDTDPLCYGDSPTFNLQSLTKKDSLDLLLKTAFKEGALEIIDPANFEFAKEIAAECDGSPLLLRAVGNYLSHQHSTNESFNIRDTILALPNKLFPKLLYGGYPNGCLSSTVRRYNNLAPRIKQCFGLCSLFPRYHTIDRQILAELWIALGCIKPTKEEHRSLEDIADDYFNRLLAANLFQVKKFCTFGNERSVVMHPDAVDLSRCISGWEFVECGRNADALWKGEFKARHLSITDFKDVYHYNSIVRGLRTILHFAKDDITADQFWFLIGDFIGHHNRVRVLDLHHMNVEVVPENVCKLKHLRYLDLSDNRRIEMLPSTITFLPNLQTLRLSRCSALKELPRDMRKMIALRHIYIDGCRKLSLMPKGIGDLKFLNLLTDFILPPDDSSSVDYANFADLWKLNNLRGSLTITNLSFSEFERAVAREKFKVESLLHEKTSLESLELRFGNMRNDLFLLNDLLPHPNLRGLKIHNYGGRVFPNWMTQLSTHLPNLVEIALVRCENCVYLPQFGQLHHLKSLTIQGLPDLEKINDDTDTRPFGELSSLSICDCPKLVRLPMIPRLAKLNLVNVSEQLLTEPFCVDSILKTLHLENIELLHHISEEWQGKLSSLEELHIRSCPKLNYLPMVIPSLTKLTMVKVGEELFNHPCRLPSLKTLRVENIEFLDHLPEQWLQNLTNLKELHIGSCPSLVSLSRGMIQLENLDSLSIWNCKELDLSKDEIIMEQQGPKNLKFLTINKVSKMEYLPEWLSDAYTLKFLCIRSFLNLIELPMWIGNLKSIKLLELVHCPRLTTLPSWINEFSDDYPRKLNIVGCPHLDTEGIKHSCRL